MLTGLLVAIAVELLVVLELLRRLCGIVGGTGYTPWRYKIADAINEIRPGTL